MGLTQITTGGVDDNINIDSNTLKVDGTNNRVGIGTASPQYFLHVKGGSGTSYRNLAWFQGTGTHATAGFERAVALGASNDGAHVDAWNGTSGSRGNASLLLQSAGGNVGIGTTSPQELLHIHTTSAGANLLHFSTNTSGSTSADGGVIGLSSSNKLYFYNREAGSIEFGTSNSARATIDSSGRVGVGTSSPSSYNAAADNLVIYDSGNAGITIRSGTSSDGAIYFNDTDDANQRGIIRYVHASDALAFHTSAGESLRIDSSGNVGIGLDTSLAGLCVNNSIRSQNTSSNISYIGFTGYTGNTTVGSMFSYMGGDGRNTGYLNFSTNDTERMRLDTSGRLLINHTADTAPSGFESKLQLCDTSYQGSSLLLRRDSNDASAPHLLFAKSRSSSKGGSTVIQTNDICGRILWFAADGTDANNQVAYVDAVIDVGPSTDDTPGRLVFGTTSDSTRAASERMRITSSGYAKHSNNANYYNSGASYHEFNQSIAAQNTIFNSTNSNFGATHVALHVSRAATTAYWFLQGVSGSGSSNDTEFYIRGDGNAFADGSWSGGGADYAEYFEWSDGNTEAEDRRGISVVLDGNKIREAVEGEEPIGVISGNPSVVGDADVDRWKGKYLRDDFGTYIHEDYEVEDDDGNTVVQQRRKLNPDYNPDAEYVSREDRPEWDCVGLMGKLRIRKGQVTGSRWIKMRDISDSVEEWLVR